MANARALPLHDEIVTAMMIHDVDPMERTFHGSHDAMVTTAVARERFTPPVPSYRSTNLDFWKNFNNNVKYLEAKSIAQKQIDMKKVRKKVKPILINRRLPQRVIQDQKEPAAILSCKFPPAKLRGITESNEVVYNVSDLVKFADKKYDKNYKPVPIVRGSSYIAPQDIDEAKQQQEEEEGCVRLIESSDDKLVADSVLLVVDNSLQVKSSPEKKKKEKASKQETQQISKISTGESNMVVSVVSGGGPPLKQESSVAGASLVEEKDLRPAAHSSLEMLPSSSMRELSGHNPSGHNHSLLNPFNDSLASNSLEKTSFMSNTVVPTLNLSSIIANQESENSKDRRIKKDKANNVAPTSQSQVLDQQPSIALTADIDDFKFVKSMMEGTFFTADDQTKTVTAHPAVSRPESKKRRQRREEQERRKALLKPVKPAIYGDIGTELPGGVMMQGPSRSKQVRPITQTCTFPTVQELETAISAPPKGGTFLASSRFPTSGLDHLLSRNKSGVEIPKATDKQLLLDGGRFSSTERFSKNMNALPSPAPGDFHIQRLFEDNVEGRGKRLTVERTRDLVEKIEGERVLRNQSCNYMATQAVFGYGCSVEEHIKYGLCLDGMCGRRSKWEDVMILQSDERRLGQGGVLSTSPNKTSAISSTYDSSFGDTIVQESSIKTSVSMNMSKKTMTTIDNLRKALHSAEAPDFSPLKTASLRGDFETIVKLCLLGADINERDRNDETVLHQAVLRNYLHIIVCLTEVEGYSECLNAELKHICTTQSRGMFRNPNIANCFLDLNAQDKNGNTPLHVAAMRGNGLIAEALCDAGVIPDGIKNKDGLTASDVAKTQRLFQIIKMCMAKYEAKEELREIHQRRRELIQQKRFQTENMNSETDLGGSAGYLDGEEEEYEVFEEEVTDVTNCVSKHANQQHSLYVGYFGQHQQPPQKQSERERYARFLKMRGRR